MTRAKDPQRTVPERQRGRSAKKALRLSAFDRQSISSLLSTDSTSTVGSLLGKLRLDDDDNEVESKRSSTASGNDDVDGSNRDGGGIHPLGHPPARPSVVAIPASRFRSLRPLLRALEQRQAHSAAKSAQAMGNQVRLVQNSRAVLESAADVRSIHVVPQRESISSVEIAGEGDGSIEDESEDDTATDGSEDMTAEITTATATAGAVKIPAAGSADARGGRADTCEGPVISTPVSTPPKHYSHMHSFSNPVNTVPTRGPSTPLSKAFHNQFYHATAPSPVRVRPPLPRSRTTVENTTEFPTDNSRMVDSATAGYARPNFPSAGRSNSFSSGQLTEMHARAILQRLATNTSSGSDSDDDEEEAVREAAQGGEPAPAIPPPTARTRRVHAYRQLARIPRRHAGLKGQQAEDERHLAERRLSDLPGTADSSFSSGSFTSASSMSPASSIAPPSVPPPQSPFLRSEGFAPVKKIPSAGATVSAGANGFSAGGMSAGGIGAGGASAPPTARTAAFHGLGIKPQQPYRSSLTPESRVAMAIALRKSGDTREASYQLRMAAAQGNREALFLYGLSLRYGYGVARQPRESFLCICEAGEIAPDRPYEFHVDPAALLNRCRTTHRRIQPHEPRCSILFEIGQAYLHGWGCRVNRREALEFFELAGSLGYVDAMNEAGKLCGGKRGMLWMELAGLR